jgi:hypothetical protein
MSRLMAASQPGTGPDFLLENEPAHGAIPSTRAKRMVFLVCPYQIFEFSKTGRHGVQSLASPFCG